MTKLISEVEKMIKKGDITMLDGSILDDIFDNVEKDMEDVHREYIIKAHQSRIEAEKVIIYQNLN